VKSKLSNIRRGLMHEGPIQYFRRIYRLGRYRYFMQRIKASNRLNSKHALVNGYQLLLPVRRQGIVEELLLFGSHEPVCTKLYRDRLRPGDVVLDVGTNLGYYLAIASSVIGSTGCIFGFEPDKELFSCAIENAGILNCQIQIQNLAVSAKPGTVLFHVSEVANWGSIRKSDILKPDLSVEVDSVSIDSFCAKNSIMPSMMRMDIEGGEVEALNGANDVLTNGRPNLFIELHTVLISRIELLQILDLLSLWGYKRYVLVDRYYDWPWSTKRARKEAVTSISHAEFKERALNGRLPNVVGVFSTGNR